MPIWKKNLIVCWFGMFASGVGLSQISPVLPLYIRYLGIDDPSSIAQFSGLAFGVTFIFSAIFSPIWGIAADKYGRKLMLLRASLGMSIFSFLTGFAPNIYILILFRMLIGITAGYATACTTFIATQTDKKHAGFALGTLATASIAGSLLGPTLAGVIETFISVRAVFLATGGLIMISFIITLLFVKENFVKPESTSNKLRDVWSTVPEKELTISILVSFLLTNISVFAVEPILTVFVEKISQNAAYISLVAGLIFSANGLANIIASPILGKLSDTKGVHKILFISVLVSAFIYVSQAFVQNPWQLLVLNFILGLASGGLRPSVNILIKKITPDELTGRIFGVVMTGGYIGITIGSFLGGQIAAWFGIRIVFYFAAALLLLNGVWIYIKIFRKMNHRLN